MLTMNYKNYIAIKLVVSLLLLVLFSWFVFGYSFNILQGDQWRWVRWVLIPFYNKEVSFFQAIMYEYEPANHSHILYLIVFILNSLFFGLNLFIDNIIGLLSIFGMIYVLNKEANFEQYALNGSKQDRKTSLLIYFAVLFLVINFVSTNLYSWSLIAFEFLYLFMTIHYLSYFRKFMDDQVGMFYFLVYTVVTYFLADAPGVASIGAVCVVMLIQLLNKAISYKKVGGFYVSVFFLVIMTKLFISVEVKHSHGTDSFYDLFSNLSENFMSFFVFGFSGLGKSFIDLPRLPYVAFDTRYLIFPIGIICALVCLYFLARVYKNCNFKRYNFELAMILVMLISLIFVGLDRVVPHGMNKIGEVFANRYQKWFVFFSIGFLYMGYKYLTINSITSRKFLHVICFTLIVCSTVIMTYQIYNFKVGMYTQRYFEKVESSMIDYAEYKNSSFEKTTRRCENSFCRSSVDFLYKNELNIFNTKKNVKVGKD